MREIAPAISTKVWEILNFRTDVLLSYRKLEQIPFELSPLQEASIGAKYISCKREKSWKHTSSQ